MNDLPISDKIKSAFASSAEFRMLCEQLEQMRHASEGDNQIAPRKGPGVSGLAGGSVAFLLAAVHEQCAGNILYVTSAFDDAQHIADDLANIIGGEAALFFPPRQMLPYEFRHPPHKEDSP